MKLGFVSRISEFPQKYWESEFNLAKRKKINCLELLVNYPFLGPSTYTLMQLKKIKNLTKQNNVSLILHLLPNQYKLSRKKSIRNKVFNIASLNEDTRKFSINEIKRTLKIAEYLGAKLITIHGGIVENKDDYNIHLDMARKTLKKLNPKFKKIKLCIENLPIKEHSGIICLEIPKKPKDLLYVVNGFDNIGICYDIGHANTIMNPISFYKKIRKSGKIWNIHIHDNNGDKDNHLSLGNGDINFMKFLRELRKDDYQGFLNIELDTWSEYSESKERTKALNYLSSVM